MRCSQNVVTCQVFSFSLGLVWSLGKLQPMRCSQKVSALVHLISTSILSYFLYYISKVLVTDPYFIMVPTNEKTSNAFWNIKDYSDILKHKTKYQRLLRMCQKVGSQSLLIRELTQSKRLEVLSSLLAWGTLKSRLSKSFDLRAHSSQETWEVLSKVFDISFFVLRVSQKSLIFRRAFDISKVSATVAIFGV